MKKEKNHICIYVLHTGIILCYS